MCNAKGEECNLYPACMLSYAMREALHVCQFACICDENIANMSLLAVGAQRTCIFKQYFIIYLHILSTCGADRLLLVVKGSVCRSGLSICSIGSTATAVFGNVAQRAS
jgi:hypothetical protein